MGGGWLTQSFPTNFHIFVRRRMLTTGESASDWREVDDAEKSRLEASDAAWTRPPQSFIDLWNDVCYIQGERHGRYNEESGYFELNGLIDITYEQALEIYNQGKLTWPYGFPIGNYCRTNLIQHQAWAFVNLYYPAAQYTPLGGISVEVLRLSISENATGFNEIYLMDNSHTILYNYQKLIKVIGIIEVSYINKMINFGDCPLLEDVKIKGVKLSSIFNFPKINYESMKYLIDNTANTSAITITVHGDIYAKLTDPSNSEWFALNEQAAQKNITFSI